MKELNKTIELIKNKISSNFLIKAKLEGICLSNSDPETDFIAIKEKNKNEFEKYSIILEEILNKNNGTIELRLIHKKSDLILSKSKLQLACLENKINSPEAFKIKRMMYEGLLGIASSNDITEYHNFINSTIKTKELVDQDGVVTKKEIKYDPPYWKFSWSHIKLFLQCPRCFYNQIKHGIKPPLFDSEGFALNRAVDSLLKKEFDQYRIKKKPHPIMLNTDAIRPLNHKKIKTWKNAYKKEGIQFKDVWKNCRVYGGVDDLWLNDKDEIIVVEYKTLDKDKINSDFNKIPYSNFFKKQVEFYAWLFKKNNYKVSSTGYLLFYSPITNKETFDCKLKFKQHLYPVEIDYYWIEPTLNNALLCLKKDIAPNSGKFCKACGYFTGLTKINENIKMVLENNKKVEKKNI